MPNKTIYVSEKDETLFNQAKELAGEALSSVIVTALQEFVARHTSKKNGMKEIAIKVGTHKPEREARFIGKKVGVWTGFSQDKEWYLSATLYRTQKDNWAVHLQTICKASLFTNKKAWKDSGDYLLNPESSELFVGKTPEELKNNFPLDLYTYILGQSKVYESPVEYLDI